MGGFLTSFKLILSLLFIIVLAYYSIRLLGKKTAGLRGNQFIRVLSALSLGQNKTLQVVVVDEKTVLLLGVGTNIECVARFDDEELAAKMLAQSTNSFRQGAPLSALANLLRLGQTKDFRNDEDFNLVLRNKLESLAQSRSELADELDSDARGGHVEK